jgi:hypothetical protein
VAFPTLKEPAPTVDPTPPTTTPKQPEPEPEPKVEEHKLTVIEGSTVKQFRFTKEEGGEWQGGRAASGDDDPPVRKKAKPEPKPEPAPEDKNGKDSK